MLGLLFFLSLKVLRIKGEIYNYLFFFVNTAIVKINFKYLIFYFKVYYVLKFLL